MGFPFSCCCILTTGEVLRNTQDEDQSLFSIDIFRIFQRCEYLLIRNIFFLSAGRVTEPACFSSLHQRQEGDLRKIPRLGRKWNYWKWIICQLAMTRRRKTAVYNEYRWQVWVRLNDPDSMSYFHISDTSSRGRNESMKVVELWKEIINLKTLRLSSCAVWSCSQAAQKDRTLSKSASYIIKWSSLCMYKFICILREVWRTKVWKFKRCPEVAP